MLGYNYKEELRPWTAAAGNISAAMTKLPALRAHLASQRQQEAEASAVRAAQVEHYGAQTGKVNEETKRLARIGMSTERMGKNFPALIKAIQSGDLSSPEVQQGIGDLAIVTGENHDDLGKLVRTLASSGMVGAAGTNMSPQQLRVAGALDNPTSVANNEANNARLTATSRNAFTAGPGSAVIDRDGKIIQRIPSAASEREQYDTQTETYPPQDAQTEVVPGAVTKRLGPMGIDWLARDEKAPDTIRTNSPAMPERKIIRKIPRGSSPMSAPAAMPERPLRGGQSLDAETAKAILQEVGGDKQKARALAQQRGYSF